jgi:hypothetical protein
MKNLLAPNYINYNNKIKYAVLVMLIKKNSHFLLLSLLQPLLQYYFYQVNT